MWPFLSPLLRGDQPLVTAAAVWVCGLSVRSPPALTGPALSAAGGWTRPPETGPFVGSFVRLRHTGRIEPMTKDGADRATVRLGWCGAVANRISGARTRSSMAPPSGALLQRHSSRSGCQTELYCIRPRQHVPGALRQVSQHSSGMILSELTF